MSLYRVCRLRTEEEEKEEEEVLLGGASSTEWTDYHYSTRGLPNTALPQQDQE